MPETCGDYLDLGEEAAYWCEKPADGHEEHEETGERDPKAWGSRGRSCSWRITWRWKGGTVDADGE